MVHLRGKNRRLLLTGLIVLTDLTVIPLMSAAGMQG
jgi:hypothetical protein